MLNNLKLTLDGVVKNVDICLINDKPFVYVATIGKFAEIPYETPRELKKKFGYLAYISEGVKSFFDKTKLHDVTYEIDGVKETVTKDSVADSGGTTLDGRRVIGLSSLPYFTEKYKPTEGEKSKEMFNKIKSSISHDDLYIKSTNGVEFEYVRENTSDKIKGYKRGNVTFEIHGNQKFGGTMDGYYWDNFEATPEELDKLYDGYKLAVLKNPTIKLKKNVTVIMDKHTGSITVE